MSRSEAYSSPPGAPREHARLARVPLAVGLLLWALPAASEHLRIELIGAGGPAPIPGVEIYGIDPQRAPSAVRRLPWVHGDSKETLAVDLEGRERSYLLLSGEGIWSPPCEIEDATCRFQVESGGQVSFLFTGPPDRPAELPSVFLASVWRRQVSTREAEAPTLCQKDEASQAWTCAVPLGDFDLRLDLPGLAPVYLWSLEAGTGSEEAFVEVKVARGAHVEGWIDVGGGVARLRPSGKWRGVPEERLSFATREVEIGGDGRLHFANVAPGTYELTVTSPTSGKAGLDLTVEPSDDRVVLGEIHLQHAARLEVQVDPPMDGWGEPWRISLSPAEGDASAAHVQRVSLDLTGYGTIEEVRSGRYFVTIRDSRESVWHLAAHRLDGDAPLTLSIPHVPVEGRIHFGDEPLEATVVFGTTQGATQFRFRSDDSGGFEGYLPEGGTWEVELVDTETGCERCGGGLGVTLLPAVEVEVGPSGKAFVDIELPDTVVEGRVLRGPPGDALPVARAQVMAVRPDAPPDRVGRLAQVWSDDEGRFALIGLEPGRVRLGARTEIGEGESAWEEIELEEGVELPEIELHIEQKILLHFRLTRAGAAVPGARLHAFPDRGMSAHTTTDLDGRAALRVPVRSSGPLLVNAVGLGLILDSFAVGESPSPPRDIEGSTETGDLLLEGFSAPPVAGFLIRGDAQLSLHALRNFAPDRVATTPAGIVYAGLAAGEYSVCAGAAGTCRRVTVAASGTASLDRTAWESAR